jgi:hypothetical protein
MEWEGEEETRDKSQVPALEGGRAGRRDRRRYGGREGRRGREKYLSANNFLIKAVNTSSTFTCCLMCTSMYSPPILSAISSPYTTRNIKY